MAKVELKQPIVDEIAQLIEGAQSLVLVDYRGLTVDEDTRLRRSFREAGIEYKVYKNTMMKRAFEGTDFAELDPHLDGPSALALLPIATTPLTMLTTTSSRPSSS